MDRETEDGMELESGTSMELREAGVEAAGDCPADTFSDVSAPGQAPQGTADGSSGRQREPQGFDSGSWGPHPHILLWIHWLCLLA